MKRINDLRVYYFEKYQNVWNRQVVSHTKDFQDHMTVHLVKISTKLKELVQNQ